MNTVKRRRLGLSGWQEIMQRYDAAGTTVQAFCASQGLCTASFYRWRERVGQAGRAAVTAVHPRATPATGEGASPGFVDLGSLLAANGPGAALELRLDLGGGVLLQLTRH